MKRTLSPQILFGWSVLSLVAFMNLRTSALAAPATNNVVMPTQALFDYPLGKPNHRDPFFPQSIRYKPVEKTPAPGERGPIVDFYKDLILRGINSGPRGRFALVNNQTLGTGESVKITKGTQNNQLSTPLYIQVLEIKDRSVVIKVEGAPEAKELPLKF